MKNLTNGRRASGHLIDAIVDNMRQNLEELKYATLAPSRYTVYLSAAEHARLEGIIPRLQAEATRALDEELERINRPSWLSRQVAWLPSRRRPTAENAGPRWHIEFLVDTDGDLKSPGDIIVHSDLVLAPNPELGVGEQTRRITTHSSPGDFVPPDPLSPSLAGTPPPRAAPAGRALGAPVVVSQGPGLHQARARITYRDKTGDHQYDITGDQTTIGRGGNAFRVDVRLATSEDVSREHARIRRDAKTGQFFLVDLSTLGTTVNGRHVPKGVEAETALPPRARIGLADTVFLEFEQVGQ